MRTQNRMLGDDPLSDPLSGFGPMSAAPPKPPSGMSTAAAADDDDESDLVGPNNALIGSAWNAKKEAILSEYSVSGKIKVTASFLDGAEDAMSENKQVCRVSARRASLPPRRVLPPRAALPVFRSRALGAPPPTRR